MSVGRATRSRGAALLLALVAAIAVLGSVGGGGSSGGPPLDPASTSPDGAKGLALLLAQIGPGIQTTSAAPAPGSAGIALVLQDRLDGAGDRQLVNWVRSGGTLVAADPDLVAQFAAPAFGPANSGAISVGGPMPVDCDLAAIQGVEAIDPAGGVTLRPPPGATGCFTVGTGSFLVADPLGAGTVVLLGGPDLWTNASLGQDDNSVLAADLLAPRPTTMPVQWIVGPRVGGGHQTLYQLIPPRWREALIELGLALVLLALWRARRLGRPVLETPPVELPGSELVVAVGNLLHQGDRLDDAAGILRATLRRGIADQVGVAPGAPAEVLAGAAAARTGLDRDVILTTMAGPAPATEAELVALAAHADTIGERLVRAR